MLAYEHRSHSSISSIFHSLKTGAVHSAIDDEPGQQLPVAAPAFDEPPRKLNYQDQHPGDQHHYHTQELSYHKQYESVLDARGTPPSLVEENMECDSVDNCNSMYLFINQVFFTELL